MQILCSDSSRGQKSLEIKGLPDHDDEGHLRYDSRYAHLKEEGLLCTEALKDRLQRSCLTGIYDKDIPGVEIPTGKPLVYELAPKLEPLGPYYLGIVEEEKL